MQRKQSVSIRNEAAYSTVHDVQGTTGNCTFAWSWHTKHASQVTEGSPDFKSACEPEHSSIEVCMIHEAPGCFAHHPHYSDRMPEQLRNDEPPHVTSSQYPSDHHLPHLPCCAGEQWRRASVSGTHRLLSWSCRLPDAGCHLHSRPATAKLLISVYLDCEYGQLKFERPYLRLIRLPYLPQCTAVATSPLERAVGVPDWDDPGFYVTNALLNEELCGFLIEGVHEHLTGKN